jgi:DNA primase
MGTALTETQLEQLWRLVDEPILCFDGDAAGIKAAERACHRAMQSLRPGKQLRIVVLPAGQDPDDIIRTSGPERFNEIVGRAFPLATFLYQSEREKIDSSRPEQRANLRKNLEELARTCGDRFVADEFARSFKNLFFEEFGWKAKLRETIFKSSVRTSARVAPELSRLFVRSALYGLTRFPAVAAANVENVISIPISHPDLIRWRDAITDAVINRPTLNDDGIQEILEGTVLPQTLQRDIRYDLRFGFNRRDTPEDVATKQLETLVHFLGQEQTIKDHIQVRDSLAVNAVTEDEYATIEAERQRLREARANLISESANWDGGL